jgi:hypothetical protein
MHTIPRQATLSSLGPAPTHRSPDWSLLRCLAVLIGQAARRQGHRPNQRPPQRLANALTNPRLPLPIGSCVRIGCQSGIHVDRAPIAPTE